MSRKLRVVKGFPINVSGPAESHVLRSRGRTWRESFSRGAHVFDAQGRPTNLITWQNFAARSGAAITTWNYDPTNGLLVSKVYADGKGTTNTYTPGRRPRTRTWARGITTTYETNAAGQTFATTYSDGLTAAVTNYFDRLGRVTNIV